MPKRVRTRTLDDTTRASDPGQIRLSRAKLKLLRPDLFGFRAALRRLWFSSKFPQLVYIREHLQCGDSRAAVVVSTSPLLVAAYTDELDCVAVLRFPDEFRATYGLARGSRLLTVNTYKRGKAKIAEEEWSRAASMGAAYLREKPGFARDGRPVHAAVPAKRYEVARSSLVVPTDS